MGGNAFNQHLSTNAFPRIPQAVYDSVKARLLSPLQLLYDHVGVPFEAPEKLDHGDLDFIVAGSRNGCNAPDGGVNHEDVKDALGATFSIRLEGNRTSHFAVPVCKGEWDDMGHSVDEKRHRSTNGDVMYYQVDVHVCAGEAEWERIIFFHSYGDLGESLMVELLGCRPSLGLLGMILGLLARNNGLALGTKGLKIPDPPNPPFDLSSSFPTILPFFGLSLDTWTQKFSTKLQIFEWVATSRFFDPTSFRTEGEGISKVKDDRKMYMEFAKWVVTERKRREQSMVLEAHPRCERAALINEALVYFNKKEEFDELVRSRSARVRLKKAFNGHKVEEWTGLAPNWKAVKLVMDGVRERLGGDEGVLKFWEQKGEKELVRLTLEVKAEVILMRRANPTQTKEPGNSGKMDVLREYIRRFTSSYFGFVLI